MHRLVVCGGTGASPAVGGKLVPRIASTGPKSSALVESIDVSAADFAPKNPLAGLFIGRKDVPLEQALQHLLRENHKQSFFGQIKIEACQPYLARKHPQTSARHCEYLLSYTAECVPREDSLYFGLNAALRARSRECVKPWADYVYNLVTALRTLEEADVAHAYRGIPKSLDELGERFVEGGVVVFSGVTSVADNMHPMKEFVGNSGPRTLLILNLLKGYGGKKVHDFSFFPNESELILEPNATFRVQTILDLGNSLTQVELVQLPTTDLVVPF